MKDLGMITRIGAPIVGRPTRGAVQPRLIPFRSEVQIGNEAAILSLTFDAAKSLKRELETYLRLRG
jgi:hypothetical protein